MVHVEPSSGHVVMPGWMFACATTISICTSVAARWLESLDAADARQSWRSTTST